MIRFGVNPQVKTLGYLSFTKIAKFLFIATRLCIIISLSLSLYQFKVYRTIRGLLLNRESSEKPELSPQL